MLTIGEVCISFMRVDSVRDNERRMICVTDRSKGMIFAGSTKRCMYKAIAKPRSEIDSRNRDGGINEAFHILSMHYYL